MNINQFNPLKGGNSMKAKLGPVEAEFTEKDYAAIQKISKVGIFQMISDQFSYWRQLNLIRIGEKFKKKCEKRGINPKQVSPKFLAQFIEAASFDDEEDIQEIWADILAKESQEPGSISLRTVSSLKSLSKDEANTFRSLYRNAMQFNKGELAIYNDRRGDKDTIADIIKLVDCGLLVSESTSITMNIKIPPKIKRAAFMSPMKKYIVFIQNEMETEQECIIPIFSLTQAGQDILKATNIEDKETDNLSIAEKVKEMNNNLVVELFKIESYDEKTNRINYSNKNLL